MMFVAVIMPRRDEQWQGAAIGHEGEGAVGAGGG